ncbi:SMI1/KNR4 family protein [Microlunatus sp. GCM10028923]|uniref:SMI1/KNR4 family protein n=1 Tax=Microlunatus sp. GCM10028923 TaxID=3273400 RepID=UPI00366E3CC3
MALEYQALDPATQEQIATAEAELGFRIADGYRNWLLTPNGASISQGATVPGTDGNGLFLELEPVERLPIIRPFEGMHVIPRDYLVLNIGDGGSIAVKSMHDDIGSVWWADLDKAEVLGIWNEFLSLDFKE